MPNYTAKHQAARDLAEQGIPVFPCRVNAKEPACPNGFKDATTNLGVIDAWWQEADYNVAIEPEQGGWAVIDLDGDCGLATWAGLTREHGECNTTRVRTPRGGMHLYFYGSLPPTASKIGDKIDTRGRNSYVLVPPSSVDGRSYEWVGNDECAELPEWIKLAAEKVSERAHASVVDLDLPANVARARVLLRGYVDAGNVAVEGSGGDSKTYMVACEVLNLGLSEEIALDVIDEEWNIHCIPPWDRSELGVKIDNASRYAQNEAGAWGVVTANEAFGSALDKLLTAAEPQAAQRPRFFAYTLSEIASLPPPSWLIPDLLQANGLTLMYGPMKNYKSFLAMQFSLELCAKGKSVVYVGAEGGRELETRATAWAIGHGVERPAGLHIVPNMPWAIGGEMIAEFIEQLKSQGLKPDLVVIDTAARMMTGMDENNAKDVGLMVGALDAIRNAFGCAVLTLHHTGKDEGRGARGSNALAAAVDTVLEVKAHKPSHSVALYVREQRNAQEREEPWTFEGKVIGQSLVFYPTDAAAYAAATHSDELFGRKQVGTALANLNAFGQAAGITTTVLASAMTPKSDTETEEQHQQSIARASRTLRARAKDKLDCYGQYVGKDMLWFLPAKDET